MSNYPVLNIELKPFYNGESTEYLDVVMIYKNCDYDVDTVIASMTSRITSIPTLYEKESLKVFDEKGEIDLKLDIITPPMGAPFGEFSNFKLSRKPIGNILVKYRTYTREVTSETKAGPLFDLRKQGNGLLGAGITFLVLAKDERIFDIEVSWNLENMPKDSIGVWSYGEGKANKLDVLEVLNFTYFAVGNINRYKDREDSNFSLYWLGDHKIDAISIGQKISKIYEKMSILFKDADLPYKIFIRKTPYDNIGGTAVYRSFVFEYSDYKIPAADEVQILIAHEMVHNWLNIYGDDWDISVYAEGTAEFYSIFLIHELGLITKEQLIEEINLRLFKYYTNKFNNLSGKDAMDIAWQEQSSQEIPYGRGLIYMMQIDKAIRDKSEGKEDLSVVTIKLLDLKDKKMKCDKYNLFEEVSNHSDFDAKSQFEDLMQGKLILPPCDYFGDYTLVKTIERKFELGMSDNSLRKIPRTVEGLIDKSNAQIAGLKEGDIIKEISSIQDAKEKNDVNINMTVIRDGNEIKISYLPRGEEVDCYKYVLKN